MHRANRQTDSPQKQAPSGECGLSVRQQWQFWRRGMQQLTITQPAGCAPMQQSCSAYNTEHGQVGSSKSSSVCPKARHRIAACCWRGHATARALSLINALLATTGRHPASRARGQNRRQIGPACFSTNTPTATKERKIPARQQCQAAHPQTHQPHSHHQ